MAGQNGLGNIIDRAMRPQSAPFWERPAGSKPPQLALTPEQLQAGSLMNTIV